MNAHPHEPRSAPRAPRKDGDDARQRLLHTGLRLFAHHGFAQTSTRELAEAAGVNVAAISYYFGDKAGLYRAVFFEPNGSYEDDIARFSAAPLALPDMLAGFYAGLLEPLREGETAQLCMKLRMREMVEPTGLWDEEVSQGIKPMHDALVAQLCRHFALGAADDELLRLAVCITALGVHLHVGRDVIDSVAPTLNSRPEAVDRWATSLQRCALAMVDAEQRRRSAAALEPNT
jgi:AcrR family transcriptional regulator